MEIPVLSGDACRCCGDPLDGGDGGDLCRACRMAPPAFERAVAYGPYEDAMRGAIHALKYDGMHPAAKRMGRMLAQAMLKLEGDGPAEMLVIPVPLHGRKYKQRGFNQARVLAEHAVAALRHSHPQWRLTLAPKTLMRIKATETQAGLSPRQRRMNVRGAFQVSDAEAVSGRDVLLVDDIFTTGATTRAASLALRRAGAKSVRVATLARAGRVYPARTGKTGAGFEGEAEAHGQHEEPVNADMHSLDSF